MRLYPDVKILIMAPNYLDWIKEQASTVVANKNSKGHNNVYYTYFPLYDNHFVNDGHPDIVADQMVAERLIEKIDTMNVWEK